MKKRLLFLLVFAFILLPLNIHAENSTIVNTTIDTIELNSDTVRVIAGDLPAYSVTTTTPHATIQEYGSNTIWVYYTSGASAWHAFGGTTPTTVVDESTTYGMRVYVQLDEGYEFSNETKIVFNGQDITGGHSFVDGGFTWGGYVYIDLGIATYAVTFDYNGGNHNGLGTETKYWVPFAPFFGETDLMEDVTAPEGKRLAAIEIDGVRQELGVGAEINRNMTVKYLWEDIPVEPIKINGINITGITAPVGGQTANTSSITSTTAGVKVKEANWYVASTFDGESTPVTSFVAKERYLLIIVLELEDGYEFDSEFNNHITINTIALDGPDFVKEGPDIRYIFEATEPQIIPDETNQTVPDPTPVDPTPVVYELETPVIEVVKGPNNTLYINWQSNPTATRFEVYRSTNKKKWTKFNSTDATSYEQLKLTYGTTYYYKVKACNETKCTGYSNIASKKVVPDAVQNAKVVSTGAKNIKISWDKVSVTGYEVQRSTNATKGFKKVKTITKNGTLSFNNTKLKSATTYYYRVRAYKTVKGKKIYGGWSNVVSSITGPATPKKPTIKSPNFETITLDLKSSKTATYYEVQRSTNKKKNFGTIGITKSLLFTDTVQTGTTFYYRVRACNESDICSGWTSVVSKKAIPSTPTQKVYYTDVAKNTVQVMGFANEKVDGYEVFRSTKKNKNFKKYKIIDDELFPYVYFKVMSNKYYYKIRSYMIVNGKKVYSGYTKAVKPSYNETNRANDFAKYWYNFSPIMSRYGLRSNLLDEGFPVELATETGKNFSADWKINALACAKSFLENPTYDEDYIRNILKEAWFTDDEIEYAITNAK